MKDLVQKMLDAEKEEWDGMQPPEQDVGGAYYTTLGITLFQMIEQNVCITYYLPLHVVSSIWARAAPKSGWRLGRGQYHYTFTHIEFFYYFLFRLLLWPRWEKKTN